MRAQLGPAGWGVPNPSGGNFLSDACDTPEEAVAKASARAAGLPVVHYFDDSGQAYDASQCDEQIKDGDVLVVKSEEAVAVLVEAWPVAISDARAGANFHTHDSGFTWASVERVDGSGAHDYTASVDAARIEAAKFETEVADAS